MGFSVTDILKTETKLSASRLLDFLVKNANQFYSKQMLMKEGFSSNITDQLKDYVANKSLWVLSTNDQFNKKNRKNVNHYAFIDESQIPEDQLDELKHRCLMSYEDEEED